MLVDRETIEEGAVITWDGKTQTGQVAERGIYFIHVLDRERSEVIRILKN